MAYERKKYVPYAQLSDPALRMLEGLKPNEKEIVIRHFMAHWDVVRSESADDIPELPKLERRLSNCLGALCQSADEGCTNYWKKVYRNRKISERTGQESQDNNMSTNGQPMDNDWLTNGQPNNYINNQLTNKLTNYPIHPTRSEIEAFCREEGLSMVDTQGFWETMERQGWKSRNGRRVEDWKSLLRAWGRGSPGKTVSAQQYGQRPYTEKELLDASADLIAEAHQNREAMNQEAG